MPLPDIDAIRERLATSYDPYGVNPAIADVATLLAEIDRLTAELKKGDDINGKLLDLLKSEEFNRELLHRLGNALSDAVGNEDYAAAHAARKAWDAEVRG